MLLRAGIGGIIGGIVAALVWGGISYGLNAEIGWIAILVGFLVGIGARIGAGEEAGANVGVLAVAITILAIAAGKYASVTWQVNAFLQNQGGFTDIQYDREDAIASIADEIAFDRIVDGRRIIWPRGSSYDDATERQDYPTDIWNEAEREFDQLSDAEKDERLTFPMFANEDLEVSWIAEDVVDEWENSGVELDWPVFEHEISPSHEEEFPANVWAEAEGRWNAMSENEQQAFREDIPRQFRDMLASIESELVGMVRRQGFWSSWGLLDILFVLIAGAAAYKCAAASLADQ